MTGDTLARLALLKCRRALQFTYSTLIILVRDESVTLIYLVHSKFHFLFARENFKKLYRSTSSITDKLLSTHIVIIGKVIQVIIWK